jgi:hypothetical protein
MWKYGSGNLLSKQFSHSWNQFIQNFNESVGGIFPSYSNALMSPYNLTHSKCGIFFLPSIATESISAGLLGILKGILAYGIGG